MLTKQLFFLTVLLSVFGLSVSAQTSELDFSSTGTYGVGVRTVVLIDADRDNRELPVTILYPIEPPSRRRAVLIPKTDAAIFETDAPYPLVIFSVGACLDARASQDIGTHLASYGFVVISAQHAILPAVVDETCGESPPSIVQRPFDIRFMLDSIADGTLIDFAALIDLERVGVSGYSYGGYAALVTAGAGVNETALSDYCVSASSDRLCNRMLSEWGAVTDLYHRFGTSDANGNWSDFADPRIDVVAATAPCFMPLTGSEGLASLTVPSLIFSVADDAACPPERDARKIFETSNSSERYWLHWTGASDEFVPIRHLNFMYVDEVLESAKALETAFFYTHLMAEAPFAPYLETLLQAPEDWDVQSNP